MAGAGIREQKQQPLHGGPVPPTRFTPRSEQPFRGAHLLASADGDQKVVASRTWVSGGLMRSWPLRLRIASTLAPAFGIPESRRVHPRTFELDGTRNSSSVPIRP